jgi:hypothetical protein
VICQPQISNGVNRQLLIQNSIALQAFFLDSSFDIFSYTALNELNSSTLFEMGAFVHVCK